MTTRKKTTQIGFGFDPTESAHHFALSIPESGEGAVTIEERFTYGESAESRTPEPRARMDSYTWGRVAADVQSHFNRRLRDAGRASSRFGPGEHLLAPFIGKELTLLFWALDGTDPTDLPNALANWMGFAPEERWWLYTTVKASGAGPEDRDSGWRKAIRLAFAENPAPPAADGARGLISEPEPLPVSEEEAGPESKGERKRPGRKRGRHPQGPVLPLFE